MALRIGYEERCYGRAYVIVRADAGSEGALSARATAPGGLALPASVVATPTRGTYILIAPLMAFSYHVGLIYQPKDGEAPEFATYCVRAEGRPRVEAPASQLLAGGLDDIRHADLHPTRDAVWIEPQKVIDYDDGTDVVRADVVCLFGEHAEPGVPKLTLVEPSGRRFEVAPPIVLEHEVDLEADGLAVHRLQLSFRVPCELTTLIIWIHWGGREGFMVMEPWLFDRLRGEWMDISRRDSNKGDYHRWFLEHGRASDRTLHLQARTPIEDGPAFSIVVPVFETPLDYLADMLRSVRTQTYPRWELLLVNASPANEPLARALAEAEAADSRIRVLPLEGNRGITMNTRVGIDAASGSHVCFLDHDDFLEPNALYEYANAIKENPSIALIYCDEDLWMDGKFHSGYFKPDFTLDLLLNQNYVTHFLCVSREAIEGIRGTRGLPGKEFDGAQDYALTLFVAATGAPIHHVRKFLYHWRAHPGSTSISHSAKTWTDDAGKRALEAFLAGEGIAATVKPGVEQNIYDVVYSVPKEARVSAIVRRETPDDPVYACLDSLLAEAGGRLGEVVVTNPFASERGPLDLSRYGDVPIREVALERGAGTGAQRARGAADVAGDYLLFLDDRCTTRTPGWLERLLGPLQRADVAATGAGLIYEDGLIRHVGICISEGAPRFVNALVPVDSEDADYYRRMPMQTRGVSAVSGSALLVKANEYRRVGGFDESYLWGLDDVDLCLRLGEAGRSIVVVPRAELTYHGTAPNGRVLPFAYHGQPASPRSLERCVAIKHDEGLFRTRWSRFWGFGDPLYNPQLARESCHYQISRW